MSTLPLLSLTTAVSDDVDPVVTLSGFGVTTTDPTAAADTVTVSAACFVSILAVTIAVGGPAVTHCTTTELPVPLTVAIPVDDEDQVTGRRAARFRPSPSPWLQPGSIRPPNTSAGPPLERH